MGTLKEITFQLTQLVRLRLENSDILIPPVSNSGTIYCIPLTVNLFLAVIYATVIILLFHFQTL
jgi:hypothetical protein